MPAVAAVAAVAGIASAVDGRNARKDAAKGVEDANIESATQLAQAGLDGRNDINRLTDAAGWAVAASELKGKEAIQRDYNTGQNAFDQYRDRVLSDNDISSGLRINPLNEITRTLEGKSPEEQAQIKAYLSADKQSKLAEISRALEGKSPEEQAEIKAYLSAVNEQNMSQKATDSRSALNENLSSSALGGVNNKIYDTGGAVGSELARQGGIIASGFEPTYRDMLLSQSQHGVSAIDDYAGLGSRGASNMANLELSRGVNSASSLIGQGPALQQLSQGASEARALGGVANRNFNSNMVSSLASQAGNYWGGK